MVLETTTNAQGTGGAWHIRRLGTNVVSFLTRDNAGFTGFDTTATVTTTPKAYVVTWDGALTSNEATGYVNGATAGTRTYNANTTINMSNQTLYVGSTGGGASEYFNGTICEFGVCNSVLDSTDRGKLETYLSTKWGLGF
jgi:hypothetical protein